MVCWGSDAESDFVAQIFVYATGILTSKTPVQGNACIQKRLGRNSA